MEGVGGGVYISTSAVPQCVGEFLFRSAHLGVYGGLQSFYRTLRLTRVLRLTCAFDLGITFSLGIAFDLPV